MTNFLNLRYLARNGTVAPVDTAHPDNPLTGKTQRALAAADPRQRKVIWEFNGATREYSPAGGWAALDPRADLLIVIVSSLDLPRPNNGIVINPDGTTHHQIFAPKFVELSVEGLPTEHHLVEGMSDVYIDQSQQTVLGLDYQYEWVERRYYDPVAKHWGARVLIYRR